MAFAMPAPPADPQIDKRRNPALRLQALRHEFRALRRNGRQGRLVEASPA
ncbi:hypothetical protein ACQR50_07685 [Sphingomonas sp. Xoc002]